MAELTAKYVNITRLCEVDDEFGYFHMWENYSRPIDASPLVVGAPAGVYSRVYGIVEFTTGVRRVDPTKIKFCDEEHAALCAMQKYIKENDE